MRARLPSQTLVDRRRLGLAVALMAPAVCLMVVFVIMPIAWVFRVSFNHQVAGAYMTPGWVIDHYVHFLGDGWYVQNVLWRSLEIALLTTAAGAILAYPLALHIVRCSARWKRILYALVLAPLLIGIISLVFGWIVLFRGSGLLNVLTMWLGLTDEPVKYMYSFRGMIILLVYISIPYIVLSLFDNLERLEPALVEAAINMGANWWQCFRHIVLPLTMPGLYAGSIVVFALNFSAFAIPMMVGPTESSMIGLVAFRQAMEVNNLPFAAAISVIMVVVSTAVLLLYSQLIQRLHLRKLGSPG